VPVVAIDVKLGKFSTHDVLTCSTKAIRHKDIFPTIEDVKAAERKMNEAKSALQQYTQRSPNDPPDHKLHRRLAEELKRATDDYLTSVINLKA